MGLFLGCVLTFVFTEAEAEAGVLDYILAVGIVQVIEEVAQFFEAGVIGGTGGQQASLTVDGFEGVVERAGYGVEGIYASTPGTAEYSRYASSCKTTGS